MGADPQELARLRREVEELQRKAAELASRLARLEAEPEPTAAAITPEPPRTAPPRTVPPPLPSRHAPAATTRPPVAAPPPVRPSTTPAVGKVLREKTRMPSPDAPKTDWEIWLMTYLAPRVAVVTTATFAVLFLGWAVNQWGPPVRVGIGVAAALALLILGWLAERKYPDFGRVLFSAGFLLAYFVAYAAHYVEYARVIESPSVALAILAAVVALWAAAAQWRRSRTMGLWVTVLGHLTVFLSGPGPYSVAAILVLAAGGAFFLVRNAWYGVALAGLVGSYLNYALWMLHNEGSGRVRDFVIALAFLAAYYVIFAASEYFTRDEARRNVPLWYRTTYVAANSAGFLLMGTLLFQGFDFAWERYELLHFGFAPVLLALGLAYRRRDGDPLYNAYITKAVAVATLGLAVRYSGHSLTAILAVETFFLLVSARRSGLLVTRILALAVAGLALALGLHHLANAAPPAVGMPGYGAHVAEAFVAVAAFLGASLLYARTDWARRSPVGARLDPETALTLWQLDWLAAPPQRYADARKPLEGLFFPYAYAGAGWLLAVVYVARLTETGHSTPVYALLALTLTVLAAGLSFKPYGLTAMGLFAVALFAGTLEIPAAVTGGDRLSLWSAVGSLAVLAAVAVFSEKKVAGDRAGLHFHREDPAPYLLYLSVAWLLGLLLLRELGSLHESLALAAAAAVFTALAWLLNPYPLALAGTALLVGGQLTWLAADVPPGGSPLWGFAAAVLIGTPLLFDRFHRVAAHRSDFRGLDWVLLPFSGIVAYDCLEARLGDGFAFGLALASFAYLAYGLGFRAWPGTAVALFLAALGSLGLVFRTHVLGEVLLLVPLLAGYLALAAFWIVCERIYSLAVARMNSRPVPFFPAVAVSAATALLVLMLARVPRLQELYLTIGWAILAFAVFGLAVAFRRKAYRYAGLTVLGLALARAYGVDLWRLQGLQRAGAFAVITVVLLLVAFGYLKALRYLRNLDDAPPPEAKGPDAVDTPPPPNVPYSPGLEASDHDS